jgi:catechol 2,3-dioxygenase-like lactoylglutathione lyase family enzyme
VEVTSFDHVALWTSDRNAVAKLLIDGCGMHEIERTDAFTLVGGDARRGKVTLFAAEGARQPGVLERVVLRVPSLDDVRARLASADVPATNGDGALLVDATELPLAVVESDATEVADLDHVVLRVPDPVATAAEFAELGLERDGERLRVSDRELVLQPGNAREGERPLLNHLAFLVDSAEDVEREARARGLAIDDFVDAPNTLAVFVRGPDRIRLEYVEHKPGFSLE